MTKELCIKTVLSLVMTAGAIAIGFTTFVQTEIKEELEEIKFQELIDREKINGLQIQVGAVQGDIKVLLERTAPRDVIVNSQIDRG